MVTFYKSIFAPESGEITEIASIFEQIKTGGEIKSSIEAIRSDHPNKKKIKRSLPGVCFGGQFKKRSKDGLIKSSGLAILDFDKVKNAEALKDLLKQNVYIYSCWISPSGDGVKALVKIPDVQTDHEYKMYYESLLFEFKEADADKSTKDISRFCFNSYDPDIYINEKAERWTKKHVTSDKNPLQKLPKLDVSLENKEVFDKLYTWLNSQDAYSKGNRNNFIFKLLSACNRFGIPKDQALQYCNGMFDLPEKEIINTARSAYADASLFGTEKFTTQDEYIETVRQLSDGYSRGEIKKYLKNKGLSTSESENLLKNAEKTAKNKIESFWLTTVKKDEKVKIVFEPRKFIHWLEGEGFSRYEFAPGQYIYVKIDDNIIKEVWRPDIKAHVFNYIDSLPHYFDFLFREQLYNFIFNRQHNLFADGTLENLRPLDINFNRDDKDCVYLYYKNTVIRVNDNESELLNYNDLPGYVWDSQIMDREYKKQSEGKETDFKKFLKNVIGDNEQDMQAIRAVMGYLLHDFKNRAFSPMVVLNDAKMGDNANGGTGKGIFAQTFKYFKKMVTLDGKSWDVGKNFAFQTVDLDTKIVFIDDAKKNLDVEALFSVVTEGWTIEKKGKDAFYIPFDNAPKLILSTNYALKGEGNSHERRRIEFEFKNYYHKDFTPLDEFGKLLFDDWDQQDWAAFDDFIIKSITLYLKEGIKKPTTNNLKLKKFISNTCHEFEEWVHESVLPNNEYSRIGKMNEFNEATNFRVTMKSFNRWLRTFAEFKGWDYTQRRAGVNQEFMFELKADDLQKENDDMPF